MGNTNILIVDDEPSQLLIAKTIVRGLYPDIKIEETGNGMAAIKKMSDKSYDLILCDMMLPDITGEKILEFVRGHDKLSNVPFIIMTSSTDKQFIINAAKLRVTDYVIKPLTTEKIAAKLKKVLPNA
ncbi:MAG: response regulator [Nitrospirae bacterium]|nr:response regulator [Nitrospirota bacterium]